jgi:hypothetical protein
MAAQLVTSRVVLSSIELVSYVPPRPVTGIAALFHMYMMFVSHRKHTYVPPRPVTQIALHFYMYRIFVTHGKHAYEPPRPVTGIALLLTFTCVIKVVSHDPFPTFT